MARGRTPNTRRYIVERAPSLVQANHTRAWEACWQMMHTMLGQQLEQAAELRRKPWSYTRDGSVWNPRSAWHMR